MITSVLVDVLQLCFGGAETTHDAAETLAITFQVNDDSFFLYCNFGFLDLTLTFVDSSWPLSPDCGVTSADSAWKAMGCVSVFV